jgi:hypothetical protein
VLFYEIILNLLNSLKGFFLRLLKKVVFCLQNFEKSNTCPDLLVRKGRMSSTAPTQHPTQGVPEEYSELKRPELEANH